MSNSDPLGLARSQYAAYTGVGPAAPPPATTRIKMEQTQWKKRPEQPERTGVAWTDAERLALVREYLAGISPDAMALTHQRTKGALRSELMKIGFKL
jgi:hypothetical protein